MKLKDWLDKHEMSSLKINIKFLEAEFKIQDADKNAAWELYIELLTRIVTQPLSDDYGDEKTALQSVHELFPITREIIKKHKCKCIEFTKIAVVVLNQVLRPFMEKWHKLTIENCFENNEQCESFRKELKVVQEKLILYTKALAYMANVEDLTALEDL